MAIISKLRPLIRPINPFKQFKRNGGGGHGIHITPTGYVEMITWDRFHFYTLLGLVPCLLIGGLASIFIGDAVLVDTPEGYEPEDWECEKNPISRLLARYYYYDSTHGHEWFIGRLAKEQDSRLIKQLIDDVKYNQQKYEDYRAWYYKPTLLGSEARADRYARDKQEHYFNPPIDQPAIGRGPPQ